MNDTDKLNAPLFRDDALLRVKQLISTRGHPGVLPFGRNHLHKLVKAGGFPPPIKFSSRLIAWRYADVRAWLDSHKHEPYGADILRAHEAAVKAAKEGGAK